MNNKKNRKAKTKPSNPEIYRKKVVREIFKLITQGRQKESLHYFAPNCRQHNPYTPGGMEALFDAMTAVQQQEAPKYSDPYFSIKKILADGDTVAVHTEILSSKARPAAGGLRQVHLFRFAARDNKIVEYWDITQMIDEEMPNSANAF